MRCTMAVCSLLIACGPRASGGPPGDDDGAGEVDAGSPVDDDDDIDDPPNGCPEPLALTPDLPPELLVALDRSGSMDEIWIAATAALQSVIAGADADIGWGFSAFPSNDACDVGPVAVPIALDSDAAIAGAIAGMGPGGATPTWAALDEAGDYLRTRATPNPKYIVLITDGIPNCAPAPNCNCPPGFTRNAANQCVQDGGGPYDYYSCDIAGDLSINATYERLAALRDEGFHTFVVGLPTAGFNDFGLDVLAPAGGEARATKPYYYPATSPAELQATLASLSAGLVSCSFELPDVPGELEGITIDGMPVPRDPSRTDGWEIDPTGTSVRIHGSWCELLQSGSPEVEALFECPPVP